MQENSFVCSNCGNSNLRYIGYLNGEPYCRACIKFKRVSMRIDKPNNKNPNRGNYQLSYPLSKEQDAISLNVLSNYKKGINTLIFAICGAGKTELVYRVISYTLSIGGVVAFAIPRRDVVIEIHERLKETFKKAKVVAVYGGNTSDLTGDIVCLTTHQLFRYPHYFDLLIVDEIDAFPYRGDPVLESLLLKSVKKNFIMMSATPSDSVLNHFSHPGCDILRLNTRFHRHPLPVPKVFIKPRILKMYFTIKKLKVYLKQKKPVFLFVPTIEIGEKIAPLILRLVPGGNFVHSKKVDRAKIISDFKEKRYKYLITTAVLERGVTVKDLQVIIYQADHDIYDEHALVQISGRVGRKIDAPSGEVIFVADKETEAIRKCILQIKTANTYL